MALTKTKSKHKSAAPILTKDFITEMFDVMREAVRNAPHRVPTFKELDAEFDPILAQMEIDLESERLYLREYGKYPGVGVVSLKEPVGPRNLKQEGTQEPVSAKKGSQVQGKAGKRS